MLRQINQTTLKLVEIPLLGLWETRDAEFDGSSLGQGIEIYFFFNLEIPFSLFFSSYKFQKVVFFIFLSVIFISFHFPAISNEFFYFMALTHFNFPIVLFLNFESFSIVALPIVGITPSGDILAVLQYRETGKGIINFKLQKLKLRHVVAPLAV